MTTILSKEDLLTITKKPRKNQLSLKTLADFYDEYLCGRVYCFTLDSEDYPLIQLRFIARHLPHLLGIHYILKSKRYKGDSGHTKLKNGTVTFESLQSANKNWFKSKQNRMLYFPFVHQLLQSPVAIEFSSDKLSTDLDVEIIFYSQVNKAYLHLGLEKYPDSEYFFPKTFYERNNKDHIEGQKPLPIKESWITID